MNEVEQALLMALYQAEFLGDAIICSNIRFALFQLTLPPPEARVTTESVESTLL